MNVVGGDLSMTGYNITSQLGLLNPAAFAGSGAEGFVTPNPIATAVSEFSLVGIQTLAVGDSVGIGGAYNGGATHPRDEDVRFQFSTTTGQVLQGLVEYVGPANDVVLNVNPDTGEATVYHLSTHLDPVDLTGYHITSASGSLVAANWSSLVKSGAGGEGWTEANPTANAISELNLQSKSVLSNGTVISLGNIFDPLGIADIQFEFTTEDAVLMGTVTYGQVPVVAGCAPVNSLLGDLNGNGTVDFDDFVALSNNFGNAVNDYASGDIDCSGTVDFDDFVALSNNFGTSLNGAAAAVPEPSGLTLFCFAASLLTFRRGRKRMNAGYPVVMAAALAGLVTFSSAKPSHAQMDILAGQVLPIRGPDDIQGLKNPDSIQYAVNVWGEADRLVRGVDFWSDRDPSRPELDGYSTDFTHDVTNWENKPEFGDTLDDDELEEVMSDIRWTNNSPGNEFGVGVHMEVTALTEYTLELLISGNHDENRRWDIWIDEEKVVDEFQSNAEEPWDPGTAWAYNHTFVATDNELNVTFTQGETGSDGNAILQGLVLSVAGETVTAGDFNEDGQINLNDFSIMAQNFGLTFESASISRTKGDFDFDTRVNLFDFLGFRQLFNSQGAAAAIPEPNGLVTLGLGIGMVLVFGRKRKLTSKPRSQLALVVMAVGLLSTTETTYAQMDIIRGEVLPITGPADIQGLKDPGSVVYAVNVWGEADRVIRGVDFWSDRDPDRPELDGYSTDFTHDVTNWQNKPEFGDTVDDDEFEELMSDIRWTDNSPGNAFGVGVHMDVVPSNEYVLELLISGNHDEDRVWDIWIDEEQAVDEFQSNADEPYDQGIVWAYTLNFAATDDQLNVTFTQGATGSDGNAILQGLVLSLASEGTLPGDFNDDGAVNLSDFQILVENYHTDVDFGASGDINFSGRVDFLDFVEFRQAFTAAAGAPQGAAIPEPNTAWLGAIAAIFGIHLLRRRGRRSPL